MDTWLTMRAKLAEPARPAAGGTYLAGLNHLRLLAAILVFAQHAVSNCHHDELIDIGGLRIGRIGTATFFLLSGFLSASSSRSPLVWLRDRLVFLFPAYWIVTIVGFTMAWVTATKSFDVWQVLSQLAGTGYFTHHAHLVNIATWFMSPLLLLYGLTTVSRLLNPRVVTPLLIVSAAVLASGSAPEDATLLCHGVTYFLAGLVATVNPASRSRAVIGMGALMGLMSVVQPEFRYGTIASGLLFMALPVRRASRVSTVFGKFAYEWFLVHGLGLAIVSHLTSHSAVVVVGGGLLSVTGAVLLKRLVAMCPQLMRRVMSRASVRRPIDSVTESTHAPTKQLIRQLSMHTKSPTEIAPPTPAPRVFVARR